MKKNKTAGLAFGLIGSMLAFLFALSIPESQMVLYYASLGMSVLFLIYALVTWVWP